MSVLFGKPPKMHKQAATADRQAPSQALLATLDEAVDRVLGHPSVGSKSFLITIGDRSVGGLVARDQMVGPWQVPVSDVAVTQLGSRMVWAKRWPWGSERRWRCSTVQHPAAWRLPRR